MEEKSEIRVKFEIGEIKFEAEGSADLVERERSIFNNTLLPAAKGEWFTTMDVLCLMTDIFGESATKDQVNGVFKREKRWFKSEHVDGNNKLVRRKLLNEAKTFAQSLGVENVSK